MEMQFELLSGDINWEEYGGKFISPKLNNGDWDYWLVMEVFNWNEHDNDPEVEFNVSLAAVSPAAAGKKALKLALESWGVTDDMIKALKRSGNLHELYVDCLHSYGTKATLWDKSGDDLESLMAEAKEQAIVISGLFGFYMDSAQNFIGSSGWDFIRGDALAGLNRMRE